MKIGLNATRAMLVLAATSAVLWHDAAHAQIHGIGPVVNATTGFVTMVCHESGGSGAPLTDYVNNIDVSFSNNGQLETTLPGNFAVYTETNPGPNGFPTSCAVAASYLSELGFTLKQSFSHFPGYYIEVFTT